MNEWGHDTFSNGTPKIFYGGVDQNGHHWGETVTEAAYEEYKRERDPATGQQQGVGPTQLTGAGLQNAADALGGAWKPLPNLVVGFTYLAGLIKEKGVFGALTAYNGSPAYARAVEANARQWATALKGAR